MFEDRNQIRAKRKSTWLPFLTANSPSNIFVFNNTAGILFSFRLWLPLREFFSLKYLDVLEPLWHQSICLLLFSCLYIDRSRKAPSEHAKSVGKKNVDYIRLCNLLKMVTNIKIKRIRHDTWRHCHMQPPIMVLLMGWDLFWVCVLWT